MLSASCEQLRDDFARDIGETKIAALEAVGQARVVEAEEMQDGCVEVVDVDRIFYDVPADVVGLADDLPAFHAAAGHPEAERKRVMIAARDFGVAFAVFAERSASEFGAP